MRLVVLKLKKKEGYEKKGEEKKGKVRKGRNSIRWDRREKDKNSILVKYNNATCSCIQYTLQ